MKHEIEQEAKEEKQQYENEQALNEYFVRIEPIGMDRNYRRYYAFTHDDRLYVEELCYDETFKMENKEYMEQKEAFTESHKNDGKDKTEGHAVKTVLFAEPDNNSNGNGGSNSNTISNELMTITQEAIQQLRYSRPSGSYTKWSVYRNRKAIWKLYDALEPRGERERALKSALKSAFDLNEPPLVFNTSGHEYIGRKIKRIFGGKHRVSICWNIMCIFIMVYTFILFTYRNQ